MTKYRDMMLEDLYDRPAKEVSLSELSVTIAEAQQEFLESIPFNAWRFFTPTKDEITFLDSHLCFGDADPIDVNDKEFKEALEFWVCQAGGTIKWKK